MLKSTSLLGFFGIVILRLFPSCVTSYQDTFVLFALLCVIEIRQEVICFTRLCFKNIDILPVTTVV